MLRESPNAVCTVYEMSQGRQRDRALNAQAQIPNLFQGAYPVNPPERRGEVYPGDRELHPDDQVTIQIHRLNLLNRETRETLYEDIVNVAVWVPSALAGDVLIQDQGGTDEMDDD